MKNLKLTVLLLASTGLASQNAQAIYCPVKLVPLRTATCTVSGGGTVRLAEVENIPQLQQGSHCVPSGLAFVGFSAFVFSDAFASHPLFFENTYFGPDARLPRYLHHYPHGSAGSSQINLVSWPTPVADWISATFTEEAFVTDTADAKISRMAEGERNTVRQTLGMTCVPDGELLPPYSR